MKYLKPIWFVFFLLLMSKASAQETGYTIEIRTTTGYAVSIAQFSEFTFRNQYGMVFKGKIKIYNDSQFSYYNFFNELSPDTFHISEIDGVRLRTKKKHYNISPPLVALGLIFTPLLTVPVVLYKAISNKKNTYEWVGRESFTIKFSKFTTDQDNTSE